MWIRVAMLLAAAGLALGLALPGSAQASSSPARSAACAGTPGSGAGEHALPVKAKDGQQSRRALPGMRPGCAYGPGSPGPASVKNGLVCAGTPGSGAGEHALPVKMKERQHSPRAVPGAPPGCGHGSPGLASVK
jgi:hypothetical protein